MQIQNLPKAIAQNNPNQPSNLLSGLSHNHDVSGIQLKKMPVMSIDTYEKKPEEESDGSYKKPVEQNNTHAPVEEKLTSGEVSTSVEQDLTTTETPSTEPARLEEFFLPEPPDIQGQGVNTEFDWRAANYGKEGNYATELMYQTYEQLGMYDTDWSAMPPEEAEQLQKEIRNAAHSVYIEFFERDVANWIEKGVHSCTIDGKMLDKDGNQIKPKELSDEAYDAQVAEKMFDVMDFLKESNPKCYDLMVSWREANGLDTSREE